jgi:HEPN domain-containing protein
MNEVVAEWVKKAEAGARTAEREAQATDGPNWDAVCFHAQQAVEKYLKAILQQRGISFPRTHDLVILLQLLEGRQRESPFRDDAELLTTYAVEFRYPGESASADAANRAITAMRALRQHLRQQLAFDPGQR